MDTSAWYAVVSASDQDHTAAKSIYTKLGNEYAELVTCSYVISETMGLIQRRLGFKPLEVFALAIRTVEIIWIDDGLHRRSEELLFARRKRGVSIVDAACFTVMKSRRIDVAFAFDDDFRREGFTLLR